MQKSLDLKLVALRKDLSCGAFILADAKDADMAFGIAAPGRRRDARPGQPPGRSLAEFRESIREVVRQGIVDIMLMSAHTSSILTIDERLFDNSAVTPAARANDTTDIHSPRGGAYSRAPSRPFCTAFVQSIQHGRLTAGKPGDPPPGANLGLYSVTFNNDVELDRQTLQAYRDFRLQAETLGFRHFLEVFDPNAPAAPIDADVGAYVNDVVVRMLAGVPATARPIFLKMVYHGPRYTEELVNYDPTLIVGILGGSSGTTFDAFKLIAEAQKYGARAALFGRKIKDADDPLEFIALLRRIVEGEISPAEAVRAYHGALQRRRIAPTRALADDMEITDHALAYLRG